MLKKQIYSWIFLILTLNISAALDYCDDNLNICLYSHGENYRKSFSEAQNYCEQNNSILLEIYNQTYQNVVDSAFDKWLILKSFYFWLNLGYKNNELYWLTSGTKAEYFNWENGQASFKGPCSFITNSKWRPAGGCTDPHPFICLQKMTNSTATSISTTTTTLIPPGAPSPKTSTSTTITKTTTTTATKTTSTESTRLSITDTYLSTSTNSKTNTTSYNATTTGNQNETKQKGVTENLKDSGGSAIGLGIGLTFLILLLIGGGIIVYFQVKKKRSLFSHFKLPQPGSPIMGRQGRMTMYANSEANFVNNNNCKVNNETHNDSNMTNDSPPISGDMLNYAELNFEDKQSNVIDSSNTNNSSVPQTVLASNPFNKAPVPQPRK